MGLSALAIPVASCHRLGVLGLLFFLDTSLRAIIAWDRSDSGIETALVAWEWQLLV